MNIPVGWRPCGSCRMALWSRCCPTNGRNGSLLLPIAALCSGPGSDFSANEWPHSNSKTSASTILRALWVTQTLTMGNADVCTMGNADVLLWVTQIPVGGNDE